MKSQARRGMVRAVKKAREASRWRGVVEGHGKNQKEPKRRIPRSEKEAVRVLAKDG